LNLEASRPDKKDIDQILFEIENRIQTMALVHEKLCKAKDLSRIDLREYVEEVAQLLFTNYKEAYNWTFDKTHLAPTRVGMKMNLYN